MNNHKLLLLLFSLVLFVNYHNYIMPNRDKLHQKIVLLTDKIAKERRLEQAKPTKEELKLPSQTLFYNGKTLNYSQAMGALQEEVKKAVEGQCETKHLKWAQVPVSKAWYDRLTMDVVLECTPTNLFRVINRLRETGKLYKIENLTLYKMRKKPLLQLQMQFIGYRIHDAI